MQQLAMLTYPVVDAVGAEPNRHIVWMHDIREIAETGGENMTHVYLAGRDEPLLVPQPLEQVMAPIAEFFQKANSRQQQPGQGVLVPNGVMRR